jgi:hypothetical protein
MVHNTHTHPTTPNHHPKDLFQERLTALDIVREGEQAVIFLTPSELDFIK